MLQPHTSSFGELGVQGQYFDGEGHLVDHALAGAVATFVMDGFFRKKLASKMLGHDVAVFENLVLFSGDKGRDRKIDVSVLFGVAPHVAGVESIERRFSLCANLTFLAAKFLISINTKFSRVPAASFQFAAVLAHKFVSFVSVFAAAGVRASHRAVKRVASEFLFVRSQVGLHHNERLTTLFASEADRGSARGRRIFVKVLTAARDAAVFASQFNFAWVAVKRLFATQAFHLDRHSLAPLFGNRGGYSCVGREC